MDEQQQVTENPNQYMIRGKKFKFGADLTPEEVVESVYNNTNERITVKDLIPLNPKHPQHMVPKESTFTDKAIAFGADAARPLVGAAVGIGAAALGAGTIPAAVVGGLGSIGYDMARQKMSGQDPSLMEAAKNTGIDYIGGKVVQGAGKALAWGGKVLFAGNGSQIGGELLTVGQSLGETNLGKFVNGAENLFAASAKIDIMQRQATAGKKAAYNIVKPGNERFVEVPADIVANTITGIVKQGLKRLGAFNEEARNTIIDAAKGIEVRIPADPSSLTPFQMAMQMLKPGGQDIVVKQPIMLNATKVWAQRFLSNERGNSGLPELQKEAEEILATSQNGRIPREFQELFNKYYASDEAYKKLVVKSGKLGSSIVKTAQAHLRDLNKAIRDDISNGFEQWQLPDKAKMVVQDAWIRSRQALDHVAENYQGFTGLQKLIQETPGNQLGEINNILTSPDLLKRTIAAGSIKFGGEVISKDVKGDLGTLYMKNKLDAAWDKIANRFDGNALLRIFKAGGPEDSVQRQLFSAQQRSDLTHFVNTLGHMQAKGPQGSQKFMLSRRGLSIGNNGSLMALVAGSAFFLGPKIAAIELSMGALMNLAIKHPAGARKIADIASGGAVKTGGGMQKWSNELVAILQGTSGVLRMKDGQQVKGEWKNGKFVPTEY